MPLRIGGKFGLTQAVMAVLLLLLVAVVHRLSRDVHEEAQRVGRSEVPSALLAAALIDELDDLNANVLEYVHGESDERQDFEHNRAEFAGFYERLQSLAGADGGAVAEVGRLLAIYEHETRTRVFERFDPGLETWAAERVATLERDFAEPLEQLLDQRKARALGAGSAARTATGDAPNSALYVELIDEAGDLRRTLHEYLRGGLAGARTRFDRDSDAFERFAATLRAREPETLARVDALYSGLRDGGREVFERYDATSKGDALAAIDELEHGIFAEIETLLDGVAAASQADADAALLALGRMVDTNERVLWVALGLVLLLATGITVYAQHAIARPIQELHDLMAHLTRGDTDVAIAHTERGDEIGHLARAVQVFKDNTIALREKTADLEALPTKLGKYLSPQVYSSIFRGQKPVEVRAERKKLTIFFSDVVDFTETTNDLEPEDIAALLNRFLTEMSSIALEHGATIDKYVGDAILIFFGDPESRGVQEDARACVRMAVAMQRRMKQLQADWRDEGYERPLRVRMGINTGFCDVGNFGSAERMDYTIIGGEVNLAARLEGLAEPGGIVLSHETWALTKDLVKAEPGEAIHVKGIRREVVPYRVVERWDDLEAAGRVLRTSAAGLELRVDLEAFDPREGRRHADPRRAIRDLEGAIRVLEETARGGAGSRPDGREEGASGGDA